VLKAVVVVTTPAPPTTLVRTSTARLSPQLATAMQGGEISAAMAVEPEVSPEGNKVS
jgi:hypothetical protein